MTTKTTEVRKFLPMCDWPEYEQFLSSEAAEGRVVDWDLVPTRDGRGVSVLITFVEGA